MSKYKTDMYQEYVVWSRIESGPWSQTGFWECGMLNALQHALFRQYDQLNDNLREVADWYWTCGANVGGVERTFVIVRRGDAPNPEYMPWDEPISEPRTNAETYRKIAPPKF